MKYKNPFRKLFKKLQGRWLFSRYRKNTAVQREIQKKWSKFRNPLEVIRHEIKWQFLWVWRFQINWSRGLWIGLYEADMETCIWEIGGE